MMMIIIMVMIVIIIIIIIIIITIRRWNTSYQQAQYWQKTIHKTRDRVCAELYCNIC